MAVFTYYQEQAREIKARGWTGDQTTFGILVKGKIREAQGEMKVCPNCGMVLSEVTPPGWEIPVKKMKRSKGITNPWALAWWMKGQGYQPKGGKGKSEEADTEEACMEGEELDQALLEQDRMLKRICEKCAENNMSAVDSVNTKMQKGIRQTGAEQQGTGMSEYRRARETASAQEVKRFGKSTMDINEAEIEAERRSLVSVGKIPKIMRELSEQELAQHYEADIRYIANYGKLLGEKRLEEMLSHCEEVAERIKKLRQQGTATVTPAPQTKGERTATGLRAAMAKQSHQDDIDDMEKAGNKVLTVHPHDDEGMTHVRVKTPQGQVKTKELPEQGKYIGGSPGPTDGAQKMSPNEKAWYDSGVRREGGGSDWAGPFTEISQMDTVNAPLRFRSGEEIANKQYNKYEQRARKEGDKYYTDRPFANEKKQR